MYKQTLKNVLLQLNLVIDNEFLDKYVELIINNRFTEKQKFITNSHHIVPRCYYKHNHIELDNTSANKVNLTIKNHLLAHYYLYKCALEDWFKLSNLRSIKFTKNYSHSLEDIDDDWVSNNLENISSLWIEHNKLQAESGHDLRGEKNPFYGRHHTDKSKKKISATKTNPSELTRQKLRISHIGKKQQKYTIEKRKLSLKLAHKNSQNNGFAGVREKISATKRKNNSGNNRKGKIHIINNITKETKYIIPQDYDKYVSQGYCKFLTKRELAKLNKKPKQYKKVMCVNTHQVFESVAKASEYFNISETNIRKTCLGSLKSVRGYVFSYYEELGEKEC